MKTTAKIMAVVALLVLCGSAWGSEPIPGMISHWNFDEGSGITAYDYIGDNHGTIYGAVWTNGQIIGALSFDGADDYVDLSDIGFSLMGSGISSSTAFWFKINTLSPGENKVIFEQEKNTSDRYVFWFNDSTNTVNFYLDGAQATPFSINADTWYHVVGVVNGSDERFFVNGSEVGSAFSYIPRDTTGYLEVGRYPNNGNGGAYFDGLIDDVRIYNRALNEYEIEALAAGAAGPFDPSCADLDDANGVDMTDFGLLAANWLKEEDLVVINEIHYDPDVKTEQVEFVELYNPSTEDVALSGWYFSRGIDFTFPLGPQSRHTPTSSSLWTLTCLTPVPPAMRTL